MATTAEKLQLALNSKNAVKAAIIAKGVSVGNDVKFSEYATKIAAIPQGGSAEPVSAFTGTKVFATLADAAELKNYATIGALLSYKEGTGFTVWNGDSDMTKNPWNFKAEGSVTGGTSTKCGAIWANGWNDVDVPSNEYGDIVAVCVGCGMWAAPAWSGLKETKVWAASGSDMYNDFCPEALHNFDGENICSHFYNSEEHDLTGSIFAELKTLHVSGVSVNEKFYMPSKYQLMEIFDNICTKIHSEKSGEIDIRDYTTALCNMLSIASGNYWSCSQDPGYYLYAYYLTRGYYLYNDNKNFSYRSFALLRL